jgi:hypothetical protein
MIQSVDLEAHIEAHGPWLFHATSLEVLGAILVEGLRPGSEVGRSNAEGFHRTRPGHVYLSELSQIRGLQLAGDLPGELIGADLSRLNPGRIDPDEDMVQHAWLFEGERWVSAEPPIFETGWEEGPNGEGTLAYWAETTLGFDAPDVTKRSLTRGRVSYRGVIGPEALEIELGD